MSKQQEDSPFNMDHSSSERLGVFGILFKSFKNLQTNKLLIFSITFFTVSLSTLVSLPLSSSIKSWFSDLLMNFYLLPTLNPTVNATDFLQSFLNIKKDITLLLGAELIIVLGTFFMSWFTKVVTIYVLAMSHLQKNLTLKEVILGTRKIWKRVLITSFYVSLLTAGFSLLILPLSFFSLLQADGSMLIFMFWVAVPLLASLFFIYLTMVWTLSLVVSVLEDAHGFEALEKAEKLIRRRRLQGFAVTLILMLVHSIVVFIVFKIEIGPIKTAVIAVLRSIVETIILGLLQMFTLMVYTVFYFECKKSHGGEVEVEGEMGYTKVSTIPLVDPALP